VSSGDTKGFASPALRAANQNTVSMRREPLTGESKYGRSSRPRLPRSKALDATRSQISSMV
jgi:hypothetical protein